MTFQNLSPLRMNLQVALYIILSILLLVGFSNSASASTELFIQSLAEKAAEAETQKTTVVSGKKGWLFFAPELRAMSVGRFWGNAAKKVSRASTAEFADPLPAILDFKAQLDSVGITLIFVPIPAKATIYPEMISEHSTGTTRTDEHHQKFYNILREHGVNVLDLTPLFLQNRFTDAGPVYCKQDTHWSGQGCVLAADAIAKAIGTPSWAAEIPEYNKNHDTPQSGHKPVLDNGQNRAKAPIVKKIEITGDLWKELGDQNLRKEQLRLTYVGENIGASWRGSRGCPLRRQSQPCFSCRWRYACTRCGFTRSSRLSSRISCGCGRGSWFRCDTVAAESFPATR